MNRGDDTKIRGAVRARTRPGVAPTWGRIQARRTVYAPSSIGWGGSTGAWALSPAGQPQAASRRHPLVAGPERTRTSATRWTD